MTPDLALGFLASVLMAAGLVAMKSRAVVLPPATGSRMGFAVLRWFRDPIWLGGIALQTAGYALYVVALAGAPVSLLAVIMQGGIALFVVFAALFLGERARPREWIGIAGIVAAMLMLTVSLGDDSTGGATDTSTLLALSAIAVAAAFAPMLLPRLRRAGVAPALASGIAFGLGSLYTKALADLFVAEPGLALTARILDNPWLYLAAGANLSGLVLLQNSFHWSRGIVAMPLSSACSNLVPIVGGLAAFGERLPAAPVSAAMRIGAFALTIAASALLASSEEPIRPTTAE